MKAPSLFSPKQTKSIMAGAVTLSLAFAVLVIDDELKNSLRGGYSHQHQSMRRALSLDPEDVTSLAAQRPVMYTFFEPVKEGCCGMTAQGHDNLVNAWKAAWQAYGWDTRVLTESDAKDHPDFDRFQEKLIKAGVGEYNRRCFWRWLAMANQKNGGWMSDYDNFPLSLTGKIGLELEKEKGFKSFQRHVPALIQGDKYSWNKIVGLMLHTIRSDLEVNLISDMNILKYIHDNVSETFMGVSVWKDVVYGGFPYVGGEEGKSPTIDCNLASGYLTAHLSHHDSKLSLVTHTYPKIEEVIKPGKSAEFRAQAASVMMQDYRDYCVEDVPPALPS